MQGKNTVFNEILKYLPRNMFDETVERYDGDKWSKKFKYWDLFLVLLHGQLSSEICLRMVGLSHNAHHALAGKIMPRSTLSDCCMKKKPEVLMDVFWQLVEKLERKGKKLASKLMTAIQLIDSTSIMLTEKGHEWVKDNGRIKGLKVHTLYDYDLKSPVHFTITSANVNDVEEGKKLIIEPKKIYVFDKGYYDFSWWKKINEQGSFFVTRLKKVVCYEVTSKAKVKSKNIKCDQIIALTGRRNKYKSSLRYVEVKLENKKHIILVTNDLKSTAERIAELYRKRWKIELFFKHIKQNLKIKRFWGESENAIKLQIIVAMIAYVLLRLIQMISLSPYSLKEVGVIVRVNMSSLIALDKILKIPVSNGSSGILKGAKL